jgi:predicted ribosomally synthesized peptide with SipW-like signal peptide
MKKILLSLLTIALVSTVAFGATRAYFSDTQSSVNNTFTAGTLDLQLANANGGWSNDVSSTWSSPANWAPGDTVTSSIYLRNVGSIPAMAVYAYWNNLIDPSGMSNYIQVTWLSDSTDITTNNIAAFVTYYDNPLHGGNNDGKLELSELVHGVGSVKTPPPFQARFYADALETYVTPVLPANGGTFEIRMGYKFMETAGNDLQGKSASFDLTLQAAQHPYNH